MFNITLAIFKLLDFASISFLAAVDDYVSRNRTGNYKQTRLCGPTVVCL